MARTIITLHPGALGDVLLAVPALRRLRARYPGHRLVLVAGSEVANLLALAGLVDEWASWQDGAVAQFFSGPGPLSARWERWLSTCDYAVAWLHDHDGTVSSRLQSCGAQQAVVQSPFSKRLTRAHQADRFLEIIGEPPDDRGEYRLAIDSGLFSRPAREYLGQVNVPCTEPFALVHPGSGSPTKCAEPQVLAPLWKVLAEAEVQPWILEGPADRAQVGRLCALLPNEPAVLRGIDVATLAGLIAQAALFIGQDSGPTHLAGLMGTPTVALFGPTDANRWSPRGRSVKVLTGGPSFVFHEKEVVSACLSALQMVSIR